MATMTGGGEFEEERTLGMSWLRRGTQTPCSCCSLLTPSSPRAARRRSGSRRYGTAAMCAGPGLLRGFRPRYAFHGPGLS